MVLVIVDTQCTLVYLQLVNPVFMVLALSFEHLESFSFVLLEVDELLGEWSDSRVHLLVEVVQSLFVLCGLLGVNVQVLEDELDDTLQSIILEHEIEGLIKPVRHLDMLQREFPLAFRCLSGLYFVSLLELHLFSSLLHKYS